VQEAFGAFLAERGVAQFIISYCEYKEQKVSASHSPTLYQHADDSQDYVSWLEAVKGFVEH
jgi:hypothetical protein